MNKPYKEGVTKDQIILDGWSRGFKITQTKEELHAMGFEATDAEIHKAWNELNERMEQEARSLRCARDNDEKKYTAEEAYDLSVNSGGFHKYVTVTHIYDPEGNIIASIVGNEGEAEALLSHLNRE